MKENTLLLRRNSVQNLFNGYYYDSSIAAIAGSKLNSIAQQESQMDKTEGKSLFLGRVIMGILEDKKIKPKNMMNTSEITTKDLVSKN